MQSRGRGRHVVTGIAAVLAAGALAAPAAAQDDARVQNASPPSPFSQNKQNEPAVAIDQQHPHILAAGANDNIDMEACNAGTDNTCPFTDGVGTSGISFSTDSGHTWHQPQYSGLSARLACLGAPGDGDPPCTPQRGPIGTVPRYFENDLVSDGDPALAFGPRYVGGGRFSNTDSRLYYANLTAPLPGTAPFKGAEAIAVSRTDDVPGAMAGHNNAWMKPVIASRQSGAQFSDKEQIWADNARLSPHYGNVYVCYAQFRGNGPRGNQPLAVLTSHNGGATWTQHQVTPATNNTHSRNGFGRSGCTVRTDSHGVVYVFDFAFGFSPTTTAAGQMQMIKSTDGGDHWSRPVTIFRAYDTCNYFEPSIGRCVEDGVAGARSDLSPAPSVDIANGAPSGTGATNRIVISWVDGRDGLNHEHVMFSRSSNGGATWSTPRAVERPGDRGYYSAPAISPDGQDIYLVYNAFDSPFRPSAVGPNDRQLVGVVLHADWPGTAFSETHRGASGDARGSSQNDLAAEFLGDYVYAAATNSYGAAVWNDVREAADCPAIDQYRQALHDEAVQSGQQTAEAEEPRGAGDRDADPGAADEPEAPDVQQECPANFGNSDIFGGSWSDPTP